MMLDVLDCTVYIMIEYLICIILYFISGSGLICQTKAGRRLAAAQMSDVLRVMAHELDLYCVSHPWTIHRQQHLQSLVKVSTHRYPWIEDGRRLFESI